MMHGTKSLKFLSHLFPIYSYLELWFVLYQCSVTAFVHKRIFYILILLVGCGEWNSSFHKPCNWSKSWVL